MTNIPSPSEFFKHFEHFQRLAKTYANGEAFTNFHEGFAAVWEGYKPRLRQLALTKLSADGWSENSIGSGAILRNTIDAIEIQDNLGDRTNNLVFWQNRFGHGNREHRALLDATLDPKLRKNIEKLLYDLYRNDSDEGGIFDRLSELTGAKYPLLAYLYFLKDMDRFMPIQPTGFDRAFHEIGIEFTTLRQCSWANYKNYNQILGDLRTRLEAIPGLNNIRLIDAHSFCWIFSTLLKMEANGSLPKKAGENKTGRVLSGRETSIIAIVYSIEQTVQNANGQIAQYTVKNKELKMTRAELEGYLKSLLDLQENRCALTGIPFQFHGPNTDKQLRPSPDRIDSNGHYEVGNIQLVCQFINFWKAAEDNDEFKRLLAIVRGVEGE